MAAMDDVPRELLQAAYERKPIYLLKVPLHFGLWAACIALLYAIETGAVALQAYAIPIGLACSILITNLIRGLGAVAHDAVHGNCFKDKTLSYLLALLCWSPTGMSVTIYQNYHLHHHRIANTYPDVDNFVVTDYTKNPLLARLLVLSVYTWAYPLYFMFQMFRYVKRLTPMRRVRMYVELAGIFTAVGVFAMVAPWYVFLYAYGVPFILSAVLASVTSMIEHFGMSPGDDAYSSRTYSTKGHFINFLWNNVSFHNEHHKFPGIPWYNLRSFHEAAYPYYDERVKAECYEGFFPVVFKLWGQILTLDVKKIEDKYRGLDRDADREERMALPGIQSDAA